MTAGALAGEINNPQTRAIFFERELLVAEVSPTGTDRYGICEKLIF